MRRSAIPLTLLFLWADPLAFAKEQTRVLESARFHGRGNTFVAAFDSDEATRGNPATLAEAEKLNFQVRWVQADLFLGENTIDSFNDLLSIDGESTGVDLLQMFAEKFGKRQYGRFQLGILGVRIFSLEISPFVSTNNYVDVRVPATPEAEFLSDTMVGANISFGYEVSKTLALGITVRPMHRTVFRGDMTFADVLEFVDDDTKSLDDVFEKEEGFPVGVDVGAIWKPGKETRLGFLVENLGHAADARDFKNPPSPLSQRVSVGVLTRYDLRPWHLDLLADAQDLINPENYNYLRLIHLGSELGRQLFTRDHDIGLQLGVNEGYFTSGAFLDFWIARIQATYYAVELGEYPGQRKDRRWAFSLQSAATF